MTPIIRKRAAATAGCTYTVMACCRNHACALSVPATAAFLSSAHGRRSLRPSLFARQHPPVHSARRSSSSRASTVVEEVQPLTTASEQRRRGALDALTQHRRCDSSLFADMDAAAMLLETFTQATADEGPSSGSDDLPHAGVARKRMGSVAGATSLTRLRQQAARQGGYFPSPRDACGREGRRPERWAGSLIEHLDKKIEESTDEYGEVLREGRDAVADRVLTAPKKRKRGRPRKIILPDDAAKVVKVDPIQPRNAPLKENPGSDTSAAAGPGSTASGNVQGRSTSPKKREAKAVLKGADPLVGASAMVNKPRPRVVKSLPKSRRDEHGNIISNPNYNNPGRGLSNDALNLNRYYKTALLTAKEEYSFGMQVKLMVECEAVHEGLTLQLGRMPAIAEWAAACGFDAHDEEMCAANYVDSDLDVQIRPSGSDVEELAPHMFKGNGLVTDSGVGRGRGRVKTPPPASLGAFYDDSYEKFKSTDGNAEDEEAVDIFSYRHRAAPGAPVNRGSPRVFREMLLTAREAKQRMVQCNMRLVVSIARRYHGVGVNVQDLVQEGSLGLARAAEKFDPGRGFKFSTYASWWIQQAVFRSIAYHSRTIRLPVHVHNLLNKVRRARRILHQEFGRLPTNEEMAEELGMGLDRYNNMIRNTRHAISLENPKYKNNPKDLGHESEVMVGDAVDSSAVIFDEKTPEQTVDHGLLHNDIQYMLGKLGEDERTVLSLRYGIHDGITRTVTSVASKMRQTKSWVRSQECRALRKLRRPWYENRLKEHRESLQASHSSSP